jgi:5'-3' exonuclease
MSVAATEAPPEIDNLYLDMNGIIHNCTHANDPNLKLTETEMVVRIFTYLDKLIQIIKPQQLVFMAIDGARPGRGGGCSSSWRSRRSTGVVGVVVRGGGHH